MNKQLSFVVLASALLLAACGGGGDDNRNDRQQDITVPGSASQSTGGFIAYLSALIQSNADLLEPVDTSGLTAPLPEQEEPAAI